MEFLETLPVDRIGAWSTSSWGKALSDKVPSDRFAILRKSWASQSGNKALQTAASLSDRIPKAKER